MTFPHQDPLAWKVALTFVHLLSLGLTIVRIRHRWRTNRLWWDDYVVGIPWALVLVCAALLWAKLNSKDTPWYMPNAQGFIHSYWFDGFIFLTITWFSRISLTLSVARLFMPSHPYRIYGYALVVVLFLMYLTSILFTSLSCPGSPWWKIDASRCLSNPIRTGGVVIGIIWITIDFIADVILVITPLLMFWRVRFPKPRDRSLILALFAGNILTMFTSVLICMIWLSHGLIGPEAAILFKMVGELHATLALLVTNLQIASMVIYRKFRDTTDKSQTRRHNAQPIAVDVANTPPEPMTLTTPTGAPSEQIENPDVQSSSTSLSEAPSSQKCNFQLSSQAQPLFPPKQSSAIKSEIKWQYHIKTKKPGKLRTLDVLRRSILSDLFFRLVSITVIHCLALGLALIRLTHRWRTRRLWWDDYVVIIPWVFDLFSLVILCVQYSSNKGWWYKPDLSRFIFSGWFATFRYLTVIWFCHISLALSLVRVFLPGHWYKKAAFIFVIVLFLLYLLSVSISTFLCRGSPWWTVNYDRCRKLSVRQIVPLALSISSDLIANAVLIIWPLLIFWRARFSNPSDRILVLALFASGVLTMMALGIFSITWLAADKFGPDVRLLFKMTTHLHQAISLLVINLQIVSMMVYRKFRSSRDRFRRHRRPRERPLEVPDVIHQSTLSIISDYPTSLPSYTVTVAPSTSLTSSSSEQSSSEQSGSASVPQSTTSTSCNVLSSELVTTSVPESVSAVSSVVSSQPERGLSSTL
ncbi:hypothetical protein JR316_0005299 [Psilocybe cubensis]|uniref:Rhodopsin domain-containing protein n=2 Tax=Psilocybe cubensis TaxID=181762 RepID=A0A8H7XMH4_PSICU|nr:hypothetical protein JR316_0005299 [Psilocybe cubensis]KAH9483195.1 hypothetical protein JR316_0005299 [Psilocybe cubensis]